MRIRFAGEAGNFCRGKVRMTVEGIQHRGLSHILLTRTRNRRVGVGGPGVGNENPKHEQQQSYPRDQDGAMWGAFLVEHGLQDTQLKFRRSGAGREIREGLPAIESGA